MNSLEQILSLPPYALFKEQKHPLLTRRLLELCAWHRERCVPYRNILNAVNFDPIQAKSYEEIPFLPVRLFKDLELKSVADENIVKTMTSSGTTGQAVSKIYVDKITAANQQKALAKIVSAFIGPKRLPLLIIDTPTVLKDRNSFSARGAGILGFSIFGSNRCYALDENMALDLDAITAFLKKHEGKDIFLFGFTFMVWQHFYRELQRQQEKQRAMQPCRDNGDNCGGRGNDNSNDDRGDNCDGNEADTLPNLARGILIHGGGWKKLTAEAVSPATFKQSLKDLCGLSRVHDYYGMVEQTGSIYMECEAGHLHASAFSDVLIRRPEDFTLADIGEPGIIQVLSVLPESYPGHSLLTEDEGILLGEDDCSCGRSGKYFKIIGRLPAAEIRGCSDTYAVQF